MSGIWKVLASRVCHTLKPTNFTKTSIIRNKVCQMRSNAYKMQCSFYSSDIPREDTPYSLYPSDLSNLDPDLQQRFDEVVEKTGFLPNVFKALVYRPKELRAFINYYDIVMDKEYGNLTPAEKEMIVVATSAENGCLYCVVSHSALHRLFSKKPYLADQVATNWKGANISPRERAILDFAMVIKNCQTITEKDYEALALQGLNKDDAWDIGAVVSLFALSNRMAFTSGMKPNEEFYLMGRIPKPKQ